MGDRDRFRDRSPVGQKRRHALMIENLPPDYRWQDLKDLFRKETGGMGYVSMDSDDPQGRAIIEVDDIDIYKKALEKLHRYPMKGKKLIARPTENEGRSPAPRRNLDRSREDRSWEGGRDRLPKEPIAWGETYGLSPKFLEGLGIGPPLVNKVFVANLDYKVNDKKLREVFKLAGKVREVELSLDNEGKSRGFAVIEFDHPVECVQAISMLHNQQLYDRKMTVRMDRVDSNDGHIGRLPEGLANVGRGLGDNGNPLRDVARNLPKLINANANPLQDAGALNNLALGGNVSSLGSFGSNAAAAAALQHAAAAAALNPGNAALLGGPSNLDLLGRGDLTARELALRELTRGLGNQGGLGGLGPQGNLGSLSGQGGLAALGGQGGLGSSNAGLGAGSGVNNGTSRFDTSGTSGLYDSKSDSKDNFLRDRNSRGGNDNYGSGNRGKGSDTVIVENLPPSFPWQQLKDKFRDAGEVKFAEIRGNVGMIRFSSEWEALFATSLMNGSYIEGRQIEVRVM